MEKGRAYFVTNEKGQGKYNQEIIYNTYKENIWYM